MRFYRLIIFHVVASITMIAASGVDENGLLKRMQEANAFFTQEGPTSKVLEHYEEIVRDAEDELQWEGEEVRAKSDSGIQNQLPQIYYIKALIEINLNKDTQAISDLLRAWKLGSTPAKSRLVELYLERGDMGELRSLIGDEDVDTLQKITAWEEAMKAAQTMLEKGDFKGCINEVDSIVLSVSPQSAAGYETHLSCAMGAYKAQVDLGDSTAVTKVIIMDLAKLVKLQPIHNLEWYESISQFLLFGECEFEKSRQFVKNCLRIDNDFKSCGENSKFLSRFSNLLKTLEAYSIVDGHFYMDSDSDSNKAKDHVDESFNFDDIHRFLFLDDIKTSKIEKKKLPRKIQNNYDYLIHKASNFAQEKTGSQKQLSSLKLVKYLDRLTCEALVQIKDYKKAEKYCVAVKDDDFLPKFIPQIDKLIEAKKLAEASDVMKRFADKGVKHSKLFTSRYKVVEQFIAHQERQRQRQQQQRQQQYQQYQQQQQQRQYKQGGGGSMSKPKNDYYKILDVSRDADDRTIKKAHRTQTLKYHPDKYKGNDLTSDQIENKMQEINQAYEVLSDKDLRERYDRGEDPNDPMAGAQRQNPHQNFHHGGQGGRQFHFNFGDFGFGGQKVKIKRNRKRRS